MSDSVQPQRRQPTWLPRSWDSPGKNTGVGCHFLLQCMKVESESEDAQSCPTPSDPMDCSLPLSSVHGICQARVLEWQTRVQSLDWEDPLEKGKATHSSILAWRIWWTVVHGVASWTHLNHFHFHALQKLLSLIRFHLFNFAFIPITLEDWCKFTLIQFTSENVLPFFSYMIFMVSYLVFKSLKDFEFIFMYGVNECSIFINSCAAVHLSQH